VEALVATGREPRICNECIALCHEILAAPATSRGGAPPPDENASAESKLGAIVRRMGSGEQPDDEATYDRLRPSVWPGTRGPPLTYDGFRCSFCDVHRRDADLATGPGVFICQPCVVAATAAMPLA